MTLFKDPSYDFSALWALGGAGFSGSEVGEVLTAVNSINKAGLSAQTYVDTFRSLGDRLLEAPEGSKPDRQTRRLRALRAAQYYALALFSTSTYGPYGVPAALERGWNALVYDGPGQGTAALREPCRLHTTFYPGQPRRMFDKLAAPKDYVKLTAATGAQLHCSPMALQQHCDIVSDWLQETLPGR
ncbi:hypothetical protein ACWC2K_19055 [Streptomyces chattanoogensis]|uniref:hypothetical protein n=1 Tax=Streptomyces chattanoogensis TaxID=66876 RepID=UPI0036C30BED